MLFIDQKGLAKLWREQIEKGKQVEIQFHEVDWKGDMGWEAHIVTEDGTAVLVTFHSEIRYWRQLNTAKKEFEELLPGFEEFNVKLKRKSKT